MAVGFPSAGGLMGFRSLGGSEAISRRLSLAARRRAAGAIQLHRHASPPHVPPPIEGDRVVARLLRANFGMLLFRLREGERARRFLSFMAHSSRIGRSDIWKYWGYGLNIRGVFVNPVLAASTPLSRPMLDAAPPRLRNVIEGSVGVVLKEGAHVADVRPE